MRYLILILLVTFSHSLLADWKLDEDASTLSYVSIKKNMIGEVNYFRHFDAHISNSGKLNMEVDLSSVDTRIKTRDQRMRGLFFETSRFPKAEIAGQVPVQMLNNMKPGMSKRVKVKVTLKLHGHSESIDADLRLMKTGNKSFIALTESPILLNVQAFDLTQGVERLMEIAKLESITWVVPISFALAFE